MVINYLEYANELIAKVQKIKPTDKQLRIIRKMYEWEKIGKSKRRKKVESKNSVNVE